MIKIRHGKPGNYIEDVYLNMVYGEVFPKNFSPEDKEIAYKLLIGKLTAGTPKHVIDFVDKILIKQFIRMQK